MIYVKIFLFSIILSITTYIGFLKAKEYENRVIELNNIKTSLSIFKTKLKFSYEPIREIFKNISEVVYKNSNNIFICTANNVGYEDIGKVWKKTLDDYTGSLNKEDKALLKTFGNMLGKTDKDGQISQTELTEEFLEKQIEKAEDEKNKNAKLYKSLGIIIGLMIIIIFA